MNATRVPTRLGGPIQAFLRYDPEPVVLFVTTNDEEGDRKWSEECQQKLYVRGSYYRVVCRNVDARFEVRL